MKSNTLTALVLFVLALALGMPFAYRLGNRIVAWQHPLPPAFACSDTTVSADNLTAKDFDNAVYWCQLMQRMGIGNQTGAKGEPNEFAVLERRIRDRLILVDSKDPSPGIHPGMVAQFSYNWEHRFAPPSRYEE